MKICETATTVCPMNATGNKLGEAENTFIQDPTAVPNAPISTAFLSPCHKNISLYLHIPRIDRRNDPLPFEGNELRHELKHKSNNNMIINNYLIVLTGLCCAIIVFVLNKKKQHAEQWKLGLRICRGSTWPGR
jgi:hypothetical protein